MSVCVSSLPHAASRDMATTLSSRCTQYTGSCLLEAETPTIAGLFTVQNMSTTISSVPKADSTRLYLWKTLFLLRHFSSLLLVHPMTSPSEIKRRYDRSVIVTALLVLCYITRPLSTPLR